MSARIVSNVNGMPPMWGHSQSFSCIFGSVMVDEAKHFRTDNRNQMLAGRSADTICPDGEYGLVEVG